MPIQEFSHWLDCRDLATVLRRDETAIHSLCQDNQIVPRTFRTGGEIRKTLTSLQVREALNLSGFGLSKKAHYISFIMCKGGVGKTTVSYFLGQRLASYGARVLYIDSDPQANLTAALRPHQSGYTLSDRTPVLVDVLTEKCDIKDAILNLTDNLHLLPSTAINSLLERQLTKNLANAVPRLSQILRAVEKDYDFILIDCAPSLNVINASIVYASDRVLMPFQLDEFSRLGLQQTVDEIHDLEKEFSFKTSIGLLLNKFQPTEKLTFLYLGDVAAKYENLLMQTTIRQSDEIKTALAFRKDFFLKSNSKPRADFDQLARTLLAEAQFIGNQNANY